MERPENWGKIVGVKTPLLGAAASLAVTVSASAVDFQKDVLPILEDRCIECHKDGKEKADLNFQPHKIKNHIGVGTPIVPGKPNAGLFIKVILSEDPDNRMPPKGSRLSEKEVNTLKQWILEGAELGDEVAAGKEPLEGEWVNKAGRKIKATLLRVEEDKAVLKMTNGKIYKYPIAELSEASQRKIKEWDSQ